jgi:hypothetical protein
MINNRLPRKTGSLYLKGMAIHMSTSPSVGGSFITAAASVQISDTQPAKKSRQGSEQKVHSVLSIHKTNLTIADQENDLNDQLITMAAPGW